MKIFAHKCQLIINVLKAPQDKLDILELDTTKLTAQDLCNILTSLKEAAHYAQGQNIVTPSYVVPCGIGLKPALNNMHFRYDFEEICEKLTKAI